MKIKQLLTHRHWPLMVAALAVVLTLPSLGAGMFLDDLFVRLVAIQPESLPVDLPPSLDTFCFIKGDSKYISDAIDFGLFPWWVNQEVKGCFWRPLASLTHIVDHRLWPDRVWLMHLQSLAWFGALVLAAALVFRRFMGATPAAGLAALLFAVDDAHSIPVSWLANRNSLMACLFGLLALHLHHSWRKEGARAKGIAASVMFLAALFSAEAGISAMAYIAAYALVFESGPLKKRLLSLAPYAVAIIAWRSIWSALGYGVSGIPLYTDPLSAPMAFIQRLFIGLPQMITGQFALPAPEVQVLAMALWGWTWFISAAIAALFVLLFLPMMRADRTARFFGLGALFALVPACTTIAQGRNLLFVGIGAFGLLSLWLTNRPRSTAWSRSITKIFAVLLITIHLILTPLALPMLSLYPIGEAAKWQALFALPDMDEIAGRDIIIVNHPAPFNMVHYLGDRAVKGEPLPAHAWTLSQGFTHITLKRTTMRQLHLRASHGIPDHFARFVFTVSEPVKAGKEMIMQGLSVRVVKTDDRGLPIEAVYTFDHPLEDSSLRWFHWSGGAFVPFTPPAVGESVDIPGAGLPFGLSYEWMDSLRSRHHQRM